MGWYSRSSLDPKRNMLSSRQALYHKNPLPASLPHPIHRTGQEATRALVCAAPAPSLCIHTASLRNHNQDPAFNRARTFRGALGCQVGMQQAGSPLPHASVGHDGHQPDIGLCVAIVLAILLRSCVYKDHRSQQADSCSMCQLQWQSVAILRHQVYAAQLPVSCWTRLSRMGAPACCWCGSSRSGT